MRLPRPARAAVILALLVSACAASQPIRQMPAQSQRLLSHAFLDYGSPEKRPPTFDPDSGLPEIPDRLGAMLPSFVRADVIHDPALDLAAAADAWRCAAVDDRPFSVPLVRWMLWRMGSYGEYRAVHCFWFHSRRDATYYRTDGLRYLAARITGAHRGPASFGAAEVPGVRHGMSAILVDRLVAVERLPKSLRRGQLFELRGRLLDECQSPRVMLESGAAAPLVTPLTAASTDRS